MPAMGQASLEAISLNPCGIAVTLSPWLIHTSRKASPRSFTRSWSPSNRREWPRTRRAISCVTWEPKSRMRILSNSCAAFASRGPVDRVTRSSFNVVIRRFLGDLDVVDVRLAHAGGGDLDEGGARAHLVDRAAS